MNRPDLTASIEGIGFWADGLPSWPAARAFATASSIIASLGLSTGSGARRSMRPGVSESLSGVPVSFNGPYIG